MWVSFEYSSTRFVVAIILLSLQIKCLTSVRFQERSDSFEVGRMEVGMKRREPPARRRVVTEYVR
jgi:hypothetical protein